MNKEKVKHLVGTVMAICCIMSPVVMVIAITNKHLYIDKNSLSIVLIGVSFALIAILGGAFSKDGKITGGNIILFALGLIPFFVGLISSIASPWYILVSLFGVAFIILNFNKYADEASRSN